MKLRLNKSLRAAVLACCVAALSITTAKADFVWNGGSTISADNWNVAENWTLTDGTTYPTAGSGPATPYSDAWNKIIIDGASGTTAALEGWAFKMDVRGLSEVTTSVTKLQGGSAVNVEAGSTLNLHRKTGGSDGEAFDVTLGGTLNMIMYSNKGGAMTTIDFGAVTASSHGAFNLSSDTAGKSRNYNLLTFTGSIDLSAIDVTAGSLKLNEITLGTYTNDINIQSFASTFTTSENFENVGTTALTKSLDNVGKFSVVCADGSIKLCYVTGSAGAPLTWGGTTENHVWDAESDTWLSDGSVAAYDSGSVLTFGAITEGVSSTVTLTGGTYDPVGLVLEDAYTFEVTADSTLAPAAISGTGGLTKTGDAKLTTTSAIAAKVTAVNAGTLAISDRLTGSSFGGGMTVAENATLDITCVADGQGTQLVLDAESKGTVQVNGGKLRVDSAGATALGGTKLVLGDGTTLNFANSESSRTSEVSNNIEASGTITLQTWGNASTTANNIMSGTITGTADFIKTDGGTLNITGNVTANSITGHNGGGGVLKLSGTVEATNLFAASGTTEITGGTTTVSNVRLSERHDGTVNSKLVISGGTLTITGTNNGHGTGASLLISHWSGGRNGTLEVNGGALDAGGTQALMSWDGTGTLSINGGTAKLLGLNFWASANATFRGAFNLGTAEDGTGTLELGGTGFQNLGTGTTVNLGNGTIKAMADTGLNRNTGFAQGTVNLIGTNGGTKFDTNGHNFSVNSINVGGGGNLVKAGEGTLTFGGTLDAGAITIEEGTLQLNGATTIGQAITNDGTLSFGSNGKLVISDLSTWTPAGAPSYTDTQAPGSGNGYLNTSYEVVTGSGTISGTATVTVNNEDKTLENGLLVYSGNGGAYYVNNGDVVYAEGNTVASEATTGITLNGGSLTVQKELAHGVTLARNATMAIDSNGVVSKSSITTGDHSLTITGSGKYTTTEQAVGVTLGSDWTGTVTVGGLNNVTDFDIAAYATGNSTVEINGVKGYLVQARGQNGNAGLTYAQNIKFTDNGAAKALELTNGWPDNNGVPGDPFTFTGKISGDGTLYHNSTTNKTLTFTGDVSGWTGSILTNGDMGSKTMTYEFTGSATAINTTFEVENGSTGTVAYKITNDADVAVSKTITDSHESADARNLNLILSGAGTKTFGADVTVASTTLSGGAMEILDGVTFTSSKESIVAIENAEKATITGTGTVSVGTAALTYTNALIDVTQAGEVAVNATLANSTVKNSNADASVQVNADSLADGTSSLEAAEGNITVAVADTTTPVVVKNLDVAGEKTVTVGAEGAGKLEVNNTATITGTVQGSVALKETSTIAGSVTGDVDVAKETTVSGTIGGNVVVESGELAAPAVYTAASGSSVGGNVTVTSTGTIKIASADTPTAITGTLTFQNNSNVDLTALNVTADTGTITIANVGDLDVASGATVNVLGVDSAALAAANKAWVLFVNTTVIAKSANAGDSPLAIISLAGGASPMQFKVFDLAGDTPDTLTATTVTGVALSGSVLTLTLADEAASATFGKNLNLTFANNTLWGEFMEGQDNPGMNVTLAFEANGSALALGGTTVTFYNSYSGDGAGNYRLEYIPEPTTGTLSVLALAALALRRRRK